MRPIVIRYVEKPFDSFCLELWHRPSSEVVGFVHVVRLKGYWYIKFILVLPPHRRQGWATKLMHLVEERAARQGIKRIELDDCCDKGNNMYSKLGYQLVDPLDNAMIKIL